MVSQTKMIIWKNVKKYMSEGSSLNLNKDRSGRRTDRTQEDINLLQEKPIEDKNIRQKEWFGR